MRAHPRHLILFFSLVLALLASAKAATQDVARSSFGAALRMEKEGNFDLALTQYLRLIEHGQDEEVTLLAKLRAGGIYLNQHQEAEKALGLFEEVAVFLQFPDLAAAALYNIGTIRYRRAQTEDDVKAALGEFQQITLVYKTSPAAVGALMSAGMIQETLNDFPKALLNYQSVAFGYPKSDLAPEAQLRLARCLVLAGQIEEALEELQKIQLFAPQSAQAKRGLSAASGIYRLFYSQQPSLLYRSSNLLTSSLKDPSQIEVARDGTLLVLSGGRIAKYSQQGENAGPGGVGGNSFFLDNSGAIYSVSNTGVSTAQGPMRIQVKVKEELKAFKKPSTFVINSFGEMFVGSGEQGGIWKLNLQDRALVANPLARTAKLVRLKVDSQNAFYALDQSQKTLLVLERNGQQLGQISAREFNIERIEDFALDLFDNLYLLSRKGEFIVLENLHKSGPARSLARVKTLTEKPRAIAVDDAGQVYVVGKKGIVVFG